VYVPGNPSEAVADTVELAVTLKTVKLAVVNPVTSFVLAAVPNPSNALTDAVVVVITSADK
ncbi:hypothetical protein, partial [Mycoplasmopsis bovis]|uniref:hypothetical protein n=1 Tax=Mycoplasmopsis bovis TaxID=28903 RepID=UPI001C67CBCD